ncbi:hypothetical protein ABZ912_45905 [Nonomuraea angiospora]|uniref:hypothetical protein n=1 Tax=Nonomuraea angiospora TaxID=46172 RepID=UPI00340E80A7
MILLISTPYRLQQHHLARAASGRTKPLRELTSRLVGANKPDPAIPDPQVRERAESPLIS